MLGALADRCSLLRRLDREMLPYCAEPRSGHVPSRQRIAARQNRRAHDVSAAIDRVGHRHWLLAILLADTLRAKS